VCNERVLGRFDSLRDSPFVKIKKKISPKKASRKSNQNRALSMDTVDKETAMDTEGGGTSLGETVIATVVPSAAPVVPSAAPAAVVPSAAPVMPTPPASHAKSPAAVKTAAIAKKATSTAKAKVGKLTLVLGGAAAAAASPVVVAPKPDKPDNKSKKTKEELAKEIETYTKGLSKLKTDLTKTQKKVAEGIKFPVPDELVVMLDKKVFPSRFMYTSSYACVAQRTHTLTPNNNP
jgi:hypothetical protein